MENKIGTSFSELLFSELRLVSFKESSEELGEDNLVKAMTVNDELINIGYTLSSKDIVRLSRSESLDGFFNHVKSLIGDVKAAPMYPDFPAQVMELSEAQFRFHQILHYMSTYGMELIMGTPVEKGWLPNPNAPKKIKEDTRLLESKVIGLIPEEEMYIKAVSKVTGKSERMTDKELLIVKQAVGFCTSEQLSVLRVPFKQNLFELFYYIFINENLDSSGKITALKAICQHTGDVWKCIDYTLTRSHYHFRTSQKKVLVKLLESYPSRDFRDNLVLSDKKAERIKVILPFISFGTLARNPEHKLAVNQLMNGELRSWASTAVKLINTNPDEAIDFISARPGELFRKINWLIKKGCSKDKLKSALANNAEKLSIQTLVTTLNKFGETLSKYRNFDPDAEFTEKPIRFDDDFEYGDDYTAEAFNIYREQQAKEVFANKKTNEEKRVEFEAKKAEITSIIERAKNVFNICEYALAERMKSIITGLEGKKVYLDFHNYDIDMSVINCNEKSDEGGYLRSGLAIKLPENADRLRFFVYWNHPTRVDVDLHASALDIDGKNISIGWSSNFRTTGGSIVYSGDITHSDAAEYIDFDLNSNLKEITANINIYYGVPTFKELQEVYVGIMAVDKLDQKVKHYSSKNCFFSHYLTGNYRMINYGYIDVVNRVLIFDGSPTYNTYSRTLHNEPMFSLGDYLDMLFEAKNIEIVDSRKEADMVLIMEKASKDNEISLIDNNFFMK
ncbi:MAG: hypothetical protein K2J47_11390 [Ruminococcus sp.]|nr:hypothetical protein [Ruminococcus sp.]